MGGDPRATRAVNNHGIGGMTISGLEIRRASASPLVHRERSVVEVNHGTAQHGSTLRSQPEVEATQVVYALQWGAYPSALPVASPPGSKYEVCIHHNVLPESFPQALSSLFLKS